MSNTVKYTDVKKIKLNDDNPRIIKDHRFQELIRSIKEFPEMLELRPIILNKDNVILGGNMRFRASVEAGMKKVPTMLADMSNEKQREFVIKDNVSAGFWNWDELANKWDDVDLSNWGMENFMFGADTDPLNLDERIALEEELKEPIITESGYVRFEIIIKEEEKKNLLEMIGAIKKKEETTSSQAFMQIINSYKK
tara:strand:+ start:15257 stop:15844 length:588 start_codon:yes stop_codon:yes gene_type:complete